MCGIFAIINQEEQPFDYQSFCTLGCANDRRGGDSCGVFIDGKVEYGIGQKADFEVFFWTSELLNTTETARIALGHDRKASVGGISLEKAHPIIIEEDVPVAEGEEPRKEIKFVMIHNGTIYNYEELAKKYIPDIDIKGMSDSQVIARIMYYSGFNFLEEYNGGAAFVAVDYRGKEPEIVIWRGASKKYSTLNEIEEERPLFCNFDNNRLVISSVCSSVQIVDGNCFEVPTNNLITYRNGRLVLIKKIDRSKSQQNKKIEYAPVTNYGGHHSTTPVAFVRTIESSNIYKGDDNKLLDGYIRFTSFGKILNKYDGVTLTEKQHSIWFFQGIPLKEKRAYTFLCKAQKRTKLDIAHFLETYKNLIRYFSVDQLFYDNTTFYKATGPWSKQIYTGNFQMLTTANVYYFLNGYRNGPIRVTNSYDSFDVMKDVPNYDYKTIWKEFIQSME